MTPEEKDVILAAIRQGLICGVNEPVGWYLDYIRHLSMYMKYDDIPAHLELANQAFAKFFVSIGVPGDDIFESMTPENIQDNCNKIWIDRRRKIHGDDDLMVKQWDKARSNS